MSQSNKVADKQKLRKRQGKQRNNQENEANNQAEMKSINKADIPFWDTTIGVIIMCLGILFIAYCIHIYCMYKWKILI